MKHFGTGSLPARRENDNPNTALGAHFREVVHVVAHIGPSVRKVLLQPAMRVSFGAKGLEKLLSERARQQIEQYAARLPKDGSLMRRVNALARIRTDEGYMAGVETESDGTLLLVENHCPICEAATECQGLCTSELEVFQAVLGKNVTVERTDHIQAGFRRCAYRICAK